MPTNKIVLNLKDVKHTCFTHKLPPELPNWYSDRQLSLFYVENAQGKISHHNYLIELRKYYKLSNYLFYDKNVDLRINERSM